MDLLSKYKEILSGGAKKLSDTFQSAGNSIGGFITDLPANKAYLSNKVQQAVLPKEYIPAAEQIQGQHNYPLQPDNLSLDNEFTKSNSAQLNPYMVPQNTPYNQQIEATKQKVINSGVFRPAMQRYLSTVPVYGDYGNPGGGTTDVSPTQTYHNPADYSQNQSWETSQGPYQPVVEMGITKGQPVDTKNSDFKAVLAHELVHAAPRNMKYRAEFNNFFEQITPTSSPMLYKVGLEYSKNGQKPPNAEEFYATLAMQMGPNVLKIPEIRKYYENIFK